MSMFVFSVLFEYIFEETELSGSKVFDLVKSFEGQIPFIYIFNLLPSLT